tara:strand:- start:231 stop:605 length:375 start_codon:yes stop_codon:yes gene_type:complete
MNVTLPTRTLLLLALAAPLQAGSTYAPWPSQDVLKMLQKEAFLCSLNNSPDQCDPARQRADELMDHPRLPAICKDVLWGLVKESHVTTTNSFQRRDAIDQPARRLIKVCSEPVKPSKKQAPTRT